MSTGLSALMSTSAIGGSRASARSEAANEPKDKGSPFADLLGAGPATEKAAASQEAKVAKDDKDSDDDRDDSTALPADVVPALPAWLQALRVQPPVNPPGEGQPDAADGSDAALAVLASVAGSGRPSQLIADAPALPTLPTSSDEATAFTAAVGAGLEAKTATADPVLTTAQNASLDSALDALVIKADLPAVPVTAVTAERAPPPITITSASSSDPASSLLAAGPGAVLDAYGEPLPLDGPDAAVRLGERLRWLSEAGVQEARLQLHPRELGSIDVRIRVEQQTASVWFGADHPAARAALEASLPQLRERMAADGLQLGQAQIGGSAQFQSQEREANGRGRQGTPSWSATGGPADEQVPANDHLAAAVARHRGLIDRYV